MLFSLLSATSMIADFALRSNEIGSQLLNDGIRLRSASALRFDILLRLCSRLLQSADLGHSGIVGAFLTALCSGEILQFASESRLGLVELLLTRLRFG